jgi:hypothetical protein
MSAAIEYGRAGGNESAFLAEWSRVIELYSRPVMA